MRADVIVLVMGVAGSGKSTIGAAVAARLGWRFVDADEYHSIESIAKLRAGVPLTDEDRQPWLERLASMVADARRRGESLCSLAPPSGAPTVICCSMVAARMCCSPTSRPMHR
jgi:carbohydrate kinase (thermoresistant glucokinase family)